MPTPRRRKLTKNLADLNAESQVSLPLLDLIAAAEASATAESLDPSQAKSASSLQLNSKIYTQAQVQSQAQVQAQEPIHEPTYAFLQIQDTTQSPVLVTSHTQAHIESPEHVPTQLQDQGDVQSQAQVQVQSKSQFQTQAKIQLSVQDQTKAYAQSPAQGSALNQNLAQVQALANTRAAANSVVQAQAQAQVWAKTHSASKINAPQVDGSLSFEIQNEGLSKHEVLPKLEALAKRESSFKFKAKAEAEVETEEEAETEDKFDTEVLTGIVTVTKTGTAIKLDTVSVAETGTVAPIRVEDKADNKVKDKCALEVLVGSGAGNDAGDSAGAGTSKGKRKLNKKRVAADDVNLSCKACKAGKSGKADDDVDKVDDADKVDQVDKLDAYYVFEALEKILGPQGNMGEWQADFKFRSGQFALAKQVAHSLSSEQFKVQLLEAGTGIGKTYAYLIPLLLLRKRALISSATNLLQNQLALHDIPQLLKGLGLQETVSFTQLMGLRHYFCHVKLDQVLCPELALSNLELYCKRRIQDAIDSNHPAQQDYWQRRLSHGPQEIEQYRAAMLKGLKHGIGQDQSLSAEHIDQRLQALLDILQVVRHKLLVQKDDLLSTQRPDHLPPWFGEIKLSATRIAQEVGFTSQQLALYDQYIGVMQRVLACESMDCPYCPLNNGQTSYKCWYRQAYQCAYASDVVVINHSLLLFEVLPSSQIVNLIYQHQNLPQSLQHNKQSNQQDQAEENAPLDKAQVSSFGLFDVPGPEQSSAPIQAQGNVQINVQGYAQGNAQTQGRMPATSGRKSKNQSKSKTKSESFTEYVVQQVNHGNLGKLSSAASQASHILPRESFSSAPAFVNGRKMGKIEVCESVEAIEASEAIASAGANAEAGAVEPNEPNLAHIANEANEFYESHARAENKLKAGVKSKAHPEIKAGVAIEAKHGAERKANAATVALAQSEVMAGASSGVGSEPDSGSSLGLDSISDSGTGTEAPVKTQVIWNVQNIKERDPKSNNLGFSFKRERIRVILNDDIQEDLELGFLLMQRQALVIDEAHDLEAVMRKSFSKEYTSEKLLSLIKELKMVGLPDGNLSAFITALGNLEPKQCQDKSDGISLIKLFDKYPKLIQEMCYTRDQLRILARQILYKPKKNYELWRIRSDLLTLSNFLHCASKIIYPSTRMAGSFMLYGARATFALDTQAAQNRPQSQPMTQFQSQAQSQSAVHAQIQLDKHDVQMQAEVQAQDQYEPQSRAGVLTHQPSMVQADTQDSVLLGVPLTEAAQAQIPSQAQAQTKIQKPVQPQSLVQVQTQSLAQSQFQSQSQVESKTQAQAEYDGYAQAQALAQSQYGEQGKLSHKESDLGAQPYEVRTEAAIETGDGIEAEAGLSFGQATEIEHWSDAEYGIGTEAIVKLDKVHDAGPEFESPSKQDSLEGLPLLAGNPSAHGAAQSLAEPLSKRLSQDLSGQQSEIGAKLETESEFASTSEPKNAPEPDASIATLEVAAATKSHVEGVLGQSQLKEFDGLQPQTLISNKAQVGKHAGRAHLAKALAVNETKDKAETADNAETKDNAGNEAKDNAAAEDKGKFAPKVDAGVSLIPQTVELHRFKLCLTPLNLADYGRMLFTILQKRQCVPILTSATLRIAEKLNMSKRIKGAERKYAQKDGLDIAVSDFKMLKRHIGLEPVHSDRLRIKGALSEAFLSFVPVEQMVVESPFDFARRSLVWCSQHFAAADDEHGPDIEARRINLKAMQPVISANPGATLILVSTFKLVEIYQQILQESYPELQIFCQSRNENLESTVARFMAYQSAQIAAPQSSNLQGDAYKLADDLVAEHTPDSLTIEYATVAQETAAKATAYQGTAAQDTNAQATHASHDIYTAHAAHATHETNDIHASQAEPAVHAAQTVQNARPVQVQEQGQLQVQALALDSSLSSAAVAASPLAGNAFGAVLDDAFGGKLGNTLEDKQGCALGHELAGKCDLGVAESKCQNGSNGASYNASQLSSGGVAAGKTKPAILIGTDSCWTGLNLKGAGLHLVVIDKLPFTPIGCLEQQHSDLMKSFAYFAYERLPKALSRLKQGMGRLIRSEQDWGVVILATPFQTKRYAPLVYKTLEPMPWVDTPDPKIVIQFMRKFASTR